MADVKNKNMAQLFCSLEKKKIDIHTVVRIKTQGVPQKFVSTDRKLSAIYFKASMC